ncbi:MAG: hypothetical protein Q8891_14465 [Bacteroidota bacterium]|nr:hypothetical protein [Bacteroidota bacterium]
MFKKTIVFIEFLVMVLIPFLLNAQNKWNNKKLIEFGWDYPNVSLLKNNISGMEKKPFDGVVFSFDFKIYTAFDTVQYADSKFQFNDLSKIQWGKFTDNFLFIRGSGSTGPHWLDDDSWGKISRNLIKISKALAISKAKGIGFDPEYNFSDSMLNPWIYRPSLYNNLSYQEVGNYVRKRGKQFIQALQTYKPDVKILSFWLLGLVYAQNKVSPIEKTGMALFPFFVEGMLEGGNNLSNIIEGNEFSYWYPDFTNFVLNGEYVREKEIKLINTNLQPDFKNISVAKAIYLDGLYAKLPRFEKGFDKQTKERWLTDNLYFAYKTTDKYVWFYNEHVNWWKNQVDPGVEEIINEVRNKIYSEANNTNSQINGESSIPNFKEKEPNDYRGFFYNYNQKTNTIGIKLLKNTINNLQVYQNSRLIYKVDNPGTDFKIYLDKKYNKTGNLILMSKDNKGIRSVAFVN